MGDQRWSYKGQLPWFKKSEHWPDAKNPAQHGQDGHIHVSSAFSTGRVFPLTEPVAAGWEELGVKGVPDLDQNTGNNIGRSYTYEARRDGKRQYSAGLYPLDGVIIRMDTLVKKVVLDTSGGTPRATGVELADGTVLSSKSVIISGGTIRSPQLLMLSGIGPSGHLREVGVETVVDNADVGQNLSDHVSFYQHWRLRDPSQGYTVGSSNPLFQQPQFSTGGPLDWIVCTDLPKDGLAEAIKKDQGGTAPDASQHPLLSQPRALIEIILVYMKLVFPGIPMDADHLTTCMVTLLPTSKGSVTLRSTNPEDAPKSKQDTPYIPSQFPFPASLLWSSCIVGRPTLLTQPNSPTKLPRYRSGQIRRA